MRLNKINFAPRLPSHFGSQISIWHPGCTPGGDIMFSLPRLDPVQPDDETDGATATATATATAASNEGESRANDEAKHGVHCGTVLLACQIISGNSFGRAYLSYDKEGQDRVQLAWNGILVCEDYFLHVPRLDGGDSTSYAITPTFQQWRFPKSLPEPWRSTTTRNSPPDCKPSCIISGDMPTQTAHIIPQTYDRWYSDNTMVKYSPDYGSVSNSKTNVCRLRDDLDRIFDNYAFTLVPKANEQGLHDLVAHFFSLVRDSSTAALKYHNTVAHSLDSVAPEYLFARFALTIFAYIRDFVLRGDVRRVALVQLGPDDKGRQAWITEEIEMDRAQRIMRFGGGSRRSSPTKRSRIQSQLDDDVGRYYYDDDDQEQVRQQACRTRSWVEAIPDLTDDDAAPAAKRRRVDGLVSPTPSISKAVLY